MDDSSVFGEVIRDSAQIDALDEQILALLIQDGRQSARSIARDLGRSAGAILERVNRLEREGIIRGYSADVDLVRLGVGMTAIVGVEAAHGSGLTEMVERIREIPECDQAYVVTGIWDLLIRVRVRDHHHLSQVLFGKLWQLGGFRRSQTMLVLYEGVKGAGYIPQVLQDAATGRGSKAGPSGSHDPRS